MVKPWILTTKSSRVTWTALTLTARVGVSPPANLELKTYGHITTSHHLLRLKPQLHTFLTRTQHKLHVILLTRKHKTQPTSDKCISTEILTLQLTVFTSYCLTTVKVKAVPVTRQIYLPVMAGWALELGPKEVVTVTTWWLFHCPANQPAFESSHTRHLPNGAHRTCARTQRLKHVRNKTLQLPRDLTTARRSCWWFGSCGTRLHLQRQALNSDCMMLKTKHYVPPKRRKISVQRQSILSSQAPLNETLRCHVLGLCCRIKTAFSTTANGALRQAAHSTDQKTIYVQNIILFLCTCSHADHESTVFSAPIFTKNSNSQEDDVQIFYTDFYPHRTKPGQYWQ